MYNSGTAIEKNQKKIIATIKSTSALLKTKGRKTIMCTMRCGSAKIWAGSLIRLWLTPPKLGHLNFCACTPRNFPGARAQETLPDFLQKFLSVIFVKISAPLLGKPHGQQPKLLLTKIVQFLHQQKLQAVSWELRRIKSFGTCWRPTFSFYFWDIQGAFLTVPPKKTTKYKEKLKYQNCSVNCSSQKILSTRKNKVSE